MMNMNCMNMRPVTVADVLAARDARVDRQRRMLLAHGLPLISFTMNIAGEIKRDEWIERAFLEGVRRIEAALASDGIAVAAREKTLAFTGCEEIWAADGRWPTSSTATARRSTRFSV